MAVNHDDFVDVEVNLGTTHRSFYDRILGEGDDSANRFGVNLFRDGVPEDLTGASCTGYFVRPDGVTLLLPGLTSGNKAWVNIPQAGYAKSGPFVLSIKVTMGGRTSTLRIVDGNVVNTTTGAVSDPAGIVPSLANLTALVTRAETAAATIYALDVDAVQLTGTRYEIAVTKGE